ncbi:MAG: RHS repeat-associated core domain-containing protein [Bacteroidaceae bacterium]|nr:RHS repeat-associated core domain-containing protein [Bacteroidaceae bacterium]
MVDADGTVVANYSYDPYGNIISATGDLVEISPLRYRGYYYDSDSHIYYLNSRYYDPQIGRFINADAFVSTGLGLFGNNMFAYSLNNPVNMTDDTGNWPKWISNLWDAITDFFSPITGATTKTYSDGDSDGHITLTTGYSDFSLGATGQEQVVDSKRSIYQKDGFVGLTGEASIVNVNGRIGSRQNNIGTYLNGSADILALSGYAGYQYKNGLGIGAGAYATALAGTVTVDWEIYGWQIVIGMTGDIGAIGVEGKIGFIDGVGTCKFKAAAGIGGGFIVEVSLPERYY